MVNATRTISSMVIPESPSWPYPLVLRNTTELASLGYDTTGGLVGAGAAGVEVLSNIMDSESFDGA